MFAILLSQMKSGKLKKITQVVSYLPHFLSWVVIAGIWFEFLAMNGVVMDLWDAMGGTRTNLLTNKDTIIGVLVASEMWRSVGWDSIIYLSAILAISPDLYEAARLDGANRWQIIRNIILPALIAPIITVLIVNVGVVLNVGYDQILNFQNDAVLSRVDVIDTYAYRIGLQGTQYSFATAASLFKSVISLGLIHYHSLHCQKTDRKGGLVMLTQKKRFRLPQVSSVCINAIMVFVLLVVLVPMLNLVAKSFSDPAKVAGMPGWQIIPAGFSLINYEIIFSNPAIWRALLNSVFITVVGVALNVVVTSMAAYAMTRPVLPGKKLFMAFFIMMMIFEPASSRNISSSKGWD